MRSGCQNVPKIWIFKFSSSLVSQKSSESDHIAPTWSTHEYRNVHFKDSEYLKIQYKFEFWSYEKKSSDLKRSHGIDCWKNN